MSAEIVGLLALFLIALAFAAAVLAAQRLLAPGNAGDEPRDATPEPSEPADPSPRALGRPVVRFYLAALFFLVAQVAVALLYPWAAHVGALGRQGVAAIVLFSLPMIVGFAYGWTKGALDW